MSSRAPQSIVRRQAHRFPKAIGELSKQIQFRTGIWLLGLF
jgi:hypothetical protein